MFFSFEVVGGRVFSVVCRVWWISVILVVGLLLRCLLMLLIIVFSRLGKLWLKLCLLFILKCFWCSVWIICLRLIGLVIGISLMVLCRWFFVFSRCNCCFSFQVVCMFGSLLVCRLDWMQILCVLQLKWNMFRCFLFFRVFYGSRWLICFMWFFGLGFVWCQVGQLVVFGKFEQVYQDEGQVQVEQVSGDECFEWQVVL